MIVMYNNDEYKFCWDKLTRNFYIVNPDNELIYMSRNPVKAHTQYEVYVSLAFRRRMMKRGYTILGEKGI